MPAYKDNKMFEGHQSYLEEEEEFGRNEVTEDIYTTIQSGVRRILIEYRVYCAYPKLHINAVLLYIESYSSIYMYKMETVDIQAMESKLSDVTVTAIPMNSKSLNNQQPQQISKPDPGQSKYAQLLGVIEEMGREVRPTYAGSRSSAERLKRNIVSARILVRECLIETEKSARQ